MNNQKAWATRLSKYGQSGRRDNSKEQNLLRTQKMREACQTPQARAKRGKSLSRFLSTKEGKEVSSNAAKKRWTNPAYRQRQIEVRLGTHYSDEARANMSKAQKVAANKPERKALLENIHIQHDKFLSDKVLELQSEGAIVFFKDLKPHKRSDIEYYKNGRIVGLDVKSDGRVEVDFDVLVYMPGARAKCVRIHDGACTNKYCSGCHECC